MDIYENLVIGNFLFGLGVEMSRHHLGRPMPETFIGNFQQTPMDKTYADVMVNNPAIFRLIEFKREARRRDKKEVAKLWMIEQGLKSSIFTSSEAEELRAVSRSIHWFVESPKDTRAVHTIRAVPYLDLENVGEACQPITLAEFVKRIAQEASGTAKTEDDMLRATSYLRLLCKCRGSKSAALLLFVSADGEMAYEPVPDVQDIIRPRGRLEARRKEHEHQREMEQQRQIELSYEQVHEAYQHAQQEDNVEHENQAHRERLEQTLERKEELRLEHELERGYRIGF